MAKKFNLANGSSKQIMDSTTNLRVYNRARKEYLEKAGQIYCSRCRYHRGENGNKVYGGFEKESLRMPSWKISSGNSKQWQTKNRINIEKWWSKRREDYYITISIGRKYNK